MLNQRIGRLTPLIISSRFCLWLFKSPAFRKYVDGLNTGSLIQHMFTSQIDVFAIAVPPFAEQEEIVKKIDGLLLKAAAAERMTREAREAAKSLDSTILAKAFRGDLVPQDPTDEPASVLLDRICRERAAAEPAKNKKAPRRPPVNGREQNPLGSGSLARVHVAGAEARPTRTDEDQHRPDFPRPPPVPRLFAPPRLPCALALNSPLLSSLLFRPSRDGECETGASTQGPACAQFGAPRAAQGVLSGGQRSWSLQRVENVVDALQVVTEGRLDSLLLAAVVARRRDPFRRLSRPVEAFVHGRQHPEAGA